MWIVPAYSLNMRGCPHCTNNNQKKLPSLGDFEVINATTTNTILIIKIITIMSKILFLLHIFKKDRFFLATPMEVAFNITNSQRFCYSSNPCYSNHSSLLGTTKVGYLTQSQNSCLLTKFSFLSLSLPH